MHPQPRPATLADAGTARLHDALAGPGLWMDVGGAVIRVRSDSRRLADQLCAVYPHYPLCESGDWADLHVGVHRAPGLRRLWRPQVTFSCDHQSPFDPFPADSPLPLLEWGSNWLIGSRLHHYLLLHSGVLERDGLALLMPAVPGSGKSTLAAALSLRSWRLLSDEFGALCPETLRFSAMLKPVALKNQSIEVIRSFEPTAALGPLFPKTRKGTVAHLSALADAVRRRHETARPGALVIPHWSLDAPTRMEPLGQQAVFNALAFNAFNYQDVGAAAFKAVAALTRSIPAWKLTYGVLDDAVRALDEVWPEVCDRAARMHDDAD